MIKVKIEFTSLFDLWNYKGFVNKRVHQTLIWNRSLTCLCTEAETELARHAYHANVQEIR